MISVLWSVSAWAVPSDTPDWVAPEPNTFPMVMADFDGDGLSDLLVSSPAGMGLFYGSPEGPVQAPAEDLPWTSLEGYPSTFLGDFDGDGAHDLLLWRSYPDGVTEIWSGGTGGFTSQPWIELALDVDALSVQDLDGDGADELAINRDGEISVHRGGPEGLSETVSWTLSTGCSSYNLVGLDANGDGFDDLVQECPNGLRLFLGSPEGLSAEPVWGASPDDMGWSWPSMWSGDFDADGYEDLLVLHDLGYRLSLFPGGAEGLQTASWSYQHEYDWWPESVTGVAVGDLDADGDDDLVIGEAFLGDYQGMVVLMEGGPAGLGETPAWTWQGDGTAYSVGASAYAGDLNGDGADDVVVGSYSGVSVPGKTWLFYGTPRDDDGDGSPAGTDCDDGDSTVFPEAQEVDGDGLDQDCDGRDAGLGVDELVAGDLRITEVMREPSAGNDPWFELEVATEAPVDLVGLTVGWPGGEALVDSFLVLSPGDRLVVGLDLVLPGMVLEGVLQLGTLEALDLETLPSAPGVAAQLVDGAWCLASTPYGAGDLGTPGLPNAPCVEEEPAPEPAPPASEGCGCQSTPLSAGPAVLLLLAAFRRRATATL